MDNIVALSLQAPNVVVDSYGNQGTWTLIYNQGFEATVSGRTYFAFSYYTRVRSLLRMSSINSFRSVQHEDHIITLS